MPKSTRQLDCEIAEALQGRRFAKAPQGRFPAKHPAGALKKARVRPSSNLKSQGASASRSKPPTKPKSTKPKTVHSTSKKKSTKKTDRQEIETLIASADPEEWNVARDLAIQQDIQDMIVRLDMARALDVAPTEMEVIEGRPYDESFEVRLGRNQSYAVVPDEDTAYEIALARVTDDLKDEPELFTPSFVESHIDQKKLKKWVYDARMEDDYVDELAEHQVDDFWDLANRFDVAGALPAYDEEGERLEPTRKQIAAVKKAYAEDASENPMSFFEDIYGGEAVKYAIDAVGIDVKAAAKEAVNTDGWQHFLAHYDGSSDTTDSGLVYWRIN